MTDKMPRTEVMRRLRVLAACGTGKPPEPEETWLADNLWADGIAEVAAAAVDLLEAEKPASLKTRKEAMELLPKLRWYAEDGRPEGYAGWLLDSLEALGLLRFHP